mmetsp:Transcript_23170/g.23454  ORF Transcript_23170/g.23454 Transcript_23170/m.23454 type:complete len:228 (+) Transcript_23170:107-790(+)
MNFSSRVVVAVSCLISISAAAPMKVDEVVEKEPITNENDPNHSSYEYKVTQEDIERDLIVGGEVSEGDEWPYFAQTASGGCGGSLIAPRVVLTHAGCIPYTQSIVVGSGLAKIEIEEGIINPKHDVTSQGKLSNGYDVGLLLLKEEYSSDSDITLVLNEDPGFPFSDEDEYVSLDVLGMGTTSWGGKVSDVPVLRDVKVSGGIWKKCSERYYDLCGTSERWKRCLPR